MLELVGNILPRFPCGVVVRLGAKTCFHSVYELFPVGLAVVKDKVLLPVGII